MVGEWPSFGAAVAKFDAAEGFIGPLRLNDGFDQLALDELCRQIDRLGQRWRTAEVIPKSAALLLSELYPAISNCADGLGFLGNRWLGRYSDECGRSCVSFAVVLSQLLGPGQEVMSAQ
ncbi:hypothetical protein [Streptomyces graminilatus]|uniref:hypothetical protein n=1 Tax=Streptomyces graminilatus TaxID=1464070 RepID=UPI000B1F3A48|nr:hypothetical protein [Streptomyces graminilatus]